MKYLVSALAGALVSGSLWLSDFVRVEGVLSLQLELLLVHVVLGATAGALACACWQRPRILRTRGLPIVAAVLAASLLLGMALRAVLSANGMAPGRRLNVVIVVADSGVTESLASEGTLFRRVITPIAKPLPSWVSTLTGKEPRDHDVRHMFSRRQNLQDIGPTIFTKLRDDGYFTFVTSDVGGAIFSSFEGGFEHVDTPERNVTARARASTLRGHRHSLPLLHLELFRALFPSWRNIPSLADPSWVVERVIGELHRNRGRPFAGLAVFGEAEATDRAVQQLLDYLATRRTLIVVTNDPEDGETLRTLSSQSVPILLLGPGVPKDVVSDAQARHYDLAATVLDWIDADPGIRTFGHGITLFDDDALRPVCVETGIWPSPGSERLDYPELPQLLETDPASGEPVLRREMESIVETAKERGIALGHRLYREQLTPNGLESGIVEFAELDVMGAEVDLAELFDERCVDGDPSLARLHGAVVFERTH